MGIRGRSRNILAQVQLANTRSELYRLYVISGSKIDLRLLIGFRQVTRYAQFGNLDSVVICDQG